MDTREHHRHHEPGDATNVNPLLRDNPLLTPLEQEVLDEYAKLLENMNKVCHYIQFSFLPLYIYYYAHHRR